MTIKCISTPNAPSAIGPYSQAMRAGDFVYLSGQIPVDPKTGEMIDGDIEAQTRQVMRNLAAVLDEAGARWNNVVKSTIFLTDLNNFQAVNGVYGSFFGDQPPARATVQVAGLPKGAEVEIDVVAYVGAPSGSLAEYEHQKEIMGKKMSAAALADQFAAELVNATAESALEAVSSVGADEQADLVELWVKQSNAAAVAAVARKNDAPAPARKAARRGLNVLKSRGVEIPKKSNVVRPFAASTKKAEAKAELEARYTAPDSSGRAIITIVRRQVGKSIRVAHVWLAEGVGVIQVQGGATSNSKLREWENESKAKMGYGAVTVPLDWARATIAQARAQNANSKALLPLEIENHDELLLPAPTEEIAHPGLAFEGEAADEKYSGEENSRLHELPEYRGFLPSQEAVDELLQKIGVRIGPNRENGGNDQFQTYLEEEIAAATDRFFTQENREVLARRMLDGVLSVAARAGSGQAAAVLSVRKAVLEAGLVTNPPQEIPFLKSFFAKAVAVLASQNNGQLNIPLPPAADAGGLSLDADQLAAVQAAQSEAQAEREESAEGLVANQWPGGGHPPSTLPQSLWARALKVPAQLWSKKKR